MAVNVGGVVVLVMLPVNPFEVFVRGNNRFPQIVTLGTTDCAWTIPSNAEFPACAKTFAQDCIPLLVGKRALGSTKVNKGAAAELGV